MQKFINKPELVVDEMLLGFVRNSQGLVTTTDNSGVLKYVETPIGSKVGIVTGGGSGHKPAFIGYIGRNIVDVVVGEIFSSPTASAFLDAFRIADSGSGVACLRKFDIRKTKEYIEKVCLTFAYDSAET